jgi:transcription initiation factor TFIID TATA-box-binding protein
MVVTGAGCHEDAKLAATKFATTIKKLGFAVTMKSEDFKVSNVVASCDVKFAIKLEGLAYEHGSSANYEPELFPGLIYRMQVPKVVLLIFVSGKVVMTGAKKVEDVLKAFKIIYPVLYKYRKQATASVIGSGGSGGGSSSKSGGSGGGGTSSKSGGSGGRGDSSQGMIM